VSGDPLMLAALDLAERIGVPVLPLKGKIVAVPGKGGVHAATRDPEAIVHLWRRFPEANVGVACGHPWPDADGRILVVIDVDPRHGGTLEAIPEVLRSGGRMVRTGGGGWHVWTTADPGVRNSDPAPGIEIRAAGLYVVAPPSVHPETGALYEWTSTDEPRPFVPFATATSTERIDLALAEWPDGQRYKRLVSLAGTLRRRGLEHDELIAMLDVVNRSRCRPPLAAHRLETIVSSACKWAVQ